MPYHFDLDGITHDLFMLQSLIHGSRSFCKKHQIRYYSEDDDRGEFDHEYYFFNLKSVVSKISIEASIKLRMAQDALKVYAVENDVDVDLLYSEPAKDLVLGQVLEGSFSLTLRESLNKIIHATETQLCWNDGSDYKWWNGSILLSGARGSSDWKLELDLEQLCIAIHRYIELSDSVVDWAHVYKYDA